MIAWLIVYVAGLIVTALIAGVTFWFRYEDFGPEDEDTKAAARWLLGSIVWPYLVLLAVLRLIAQAMSSLAVKEEA